MLTDRDKAGHKIVIHLEQQRAYLYKNGAVVGISPVSTGREGYSTPGAKYVGAPMFYYLQIAPAYGLHAGDLPGYAASHGCIRLPSAWAKRFYYATKVGTPVVITR